MLVNRVSNSQGWSESVRPLISTCKVMPEVTCSVIGNMNKYSKSLTHTRNTKLLSLNWNVQVITCTMNLKGYYKSSDGRLCIIL